MMKVKKRGKPRNHKGDENKKDDDNKKSRL
jgi:hypothetical protein